MNLSTANLSTAILLMNPAVHVIEAVYEPDGKGPDNSKAENYKAPRELFKTFDDTIKVGDVLVVPSNTRHCVTTVKVTALEPEWSPDTTKEIKWIISTVDLAKFEELKALDDKMFRTIRNAEKTSRRNELAKKLTEHLSEEQRAELANLHNSAAAALEHQPEPVKQAPPAKPDF